VLNAAIVEFARSGYAGTSTEAIASRAGISQPYLFRLFGTKKELFIATYTMVASRIEEAFMAVTRELQGEEAMIAMGMAYQELLEDPDLLQVQLHGFVAAAADADIASACQDTFRRLWRLVDGATHADPAVIRQFFAQGMLCNVLAAIDLRSVEERWAQSFFDEDEAKQEVMLAWGETRTMSATPTTRAGSA
jgi:AcrR family transcriptional regulator